MIDEIDTVSFANRFDIWKETTPEEYARILLNSWGNEALSILAERLAKAISEGDQGKSSFLEAVNAVIVQKTMLD